MATGTQRSEPLQLERFRRLAQLLPDSTVLHVERDSVMNQIASEKAAACGLKNWQLLNIDLAVPQQLPVLAGVVFVNSLYACKSPDVVVRQVLGRVRDGGSVFVSDLGRPLNFMRWAVYLLGNSVWRQGVLPTLSTCFRTRNAQRQNRVIRKCQDDGTFWLHSLEELSAVFEREGLDIAAARSDHYLGDNDTIVGTMSRGRPVC